MIVVAVFFLTRCICKLVSWVTMSMNEKSGTYTYSPDLPSLLAWCCMLIGDITSWYTPDPEGTESISASAHGNVSIGVFHFECSFALSDRCEGHTEWHIPIDMCNWCILTLAPLFLDNAAARCTVYPKIGGGLHTRVLCKWTCCINV